MKQLIIVLTEEFSSVEGELFAFEEEKEKPSFFFPIVVGKSGMAWGRGVHDYWLLPGQHKREGDLKAPAGLFALSSVFGEVEPEHCNLPFLQVTPAHYSVDDPTSQFYNIIVSEKEVMKDWKSAEEMQRKDDLYKLGIVIDHNSDPVTPGMGSSIFMYQCRGSSMGTDGGTAMSSENLLQLVEWLDACSEPHVVQLPKVGYSAFLSSLRREPNKTAVTKRLGKLIKA